MDRLDDITLEELHKLRENVEGDVPRDRVLAAIARKQGDEIQKIPERASEAVVWFTLTFR